VKRFVPAFGIAIAVPMAASAMPALDIPAMPLRSAIVALGTAANVTIGMADPALGDVVTRKVSGQKSVSAALARMTAGTAATFVQVDAQTFRIVRRPSVIQREVAPKESRTSIPAGQAEIVVTGSKRSTPLADYPGSVSTVDIGDLPSDQLLHGSEALVRRLPVLASTHLGPGRNKLFIRGIADSSFNGPTQATVGQYLGDVRLNYSAPDPDLALHDMKSVEVLEGPQGTLYGAGSLGGVIRLEPNAPTLDRWSGSLSTGVSITAHGAPGGDGEAVLNAPIVTDRLALRIVAYGGIDGGYIDDPGRELHDINRTATRGGRATLRFQPRSDWTIDVGGVLQFIDSRDGQYALRGLPALERASVIAQPFDNDYALGSIVVRHDMGATTLTSATSVVFHDVGSTYDASLSPSEPVRYHDEHHITVLTNETRLAHRGTDGGGWVIGAELLRSSDDLHRTLGPVGTEAILTGTSNTVEEVSLFGEATLRFAPRWFVTAGGRIGFTRLVGDVLDQPSGDEDRYRHDVSALPSAGLLWKLSPSVSLFARYQEGYRPGGLAVQAGTVQRFEADSLATWEAGLRLGNRDSRLSGTASLSFAHWEDIQADLVDAAGLPYTANIGSGRVIGFELQSRWRTTASLSIEAALFLNDSNLSKPAVAFAGEKDASLPNIANLVARVGVDWRFAVARQAFAFTGSANYVGHSRLGVGPSLDLQQGEYVDTMAGLNTTVGRVTVSLDASNLLDTRGNIFAFGNPFGLTDGRQITPLRPRNIRLGAATDF
jgi:outer membrane receptor protein involved in Fe transport